VIPSAAAIRCACDSQCPSSTRAPRFASAATTIVPTASRTSTTTAPSAHTMSRIARQESGSRVAFVTGDVTTFDGFASRTTGAPGVFVSVDVVFPGA